MAGYKPRAPKTPKPSIALKTVQPQAEVPMSTYKSNLDGSWEMTVTVKGRKPLSEHELRSLRNSMSEVSFYLEQWRRTHTETTNQMEES